MGTQTDGRVRVTRVRETRVVWRVSFVCAMCGKRVVEEVLDQLEAQIRAGIYRQLNRRCDTCTAKAFTMAEFM